MTTDDIQIEKAVYNHRTELGIERFNEWDVDETLADAAIEWLEEYTGDFYFLLSLQHDLGLRGSLSRRQLAGVLNCMAREGREQTEREKPVIDLDLDDASAAVDQASRIVSTTEPVDQKVPNGTYSVVFPSGTYRTIKIKDWKNKQPEGTRIAAYLMGADNESDYQGFATIAPNGQFFLWKGYQADGILRQALSILFEDGAWRDAGEAYAVASSRCWRCSRKLTVPASIHRGLGPECAGKV